MNFLLLLSSLLLLRTCNLILTPLNGIVKAVAGFPILKASLLWWCSFYWQHLSVLVLLLASRPWAGTTVFARIST
jgi:hypothetical protein